MFGKNQILKPVTHDGKILEVQEIFPTLQGEGPYVGWPSVFVRLGGCNLACEFCDTEFDSFKKISLEDILLEVKKVGEGKKLVVITGGEPLRQPIGLLCEELIKMGFLVQIETNGTIYRDLPKEVKVICSPKNTDGKYHSIRLDLLQRIDAFKFIISKNNLNYSKVEEVGQSKNNIDVYVQPMDEYNDELNNENLQFALDLAIKEGCILSLQTHKILGIS